MNLARLNGYNAKRFFVIGIGAASLFFSGCAKIESSEGMEREGYERDMKEVRVIEEDFMYDFKIQRCYTSTEKNNLEKILFILDYSKNNDERIKGIFNKNIDYTKELSKLYPSKQEFKLLMQKNSEQTIFTGSISNSDKNNGAGFYETKFVISNERKELAFTHPDPLLRLLFAILLYDTNNTEISENVFRFLAFVSYMLNNLPNIQTAIRFREIGTIEEYKLKKQTPNLRLEEQVAKVEAQTMKPIKLDKYGHKISDLKEKVLTYFMDNINDCKNFLVELSKNEKDLSNFMIFVTKLIEYNLYINEMIELIKQKEEKVANYKPSRDALLVSLLKNIDFPSYIEKSTERLMSLSENWNNMEKSQSLEGQKKIESEFVDLQKSVNNLGEKIKGIQNTEKQLEDNDKKESDSLKEIENKIKKFTVLLEACKKEINASRNEITFLDTLYGHLKMSSIIKSIDSGNVKIYEENIKEITEFIKIIFLVGIQGLSSKSEEFKNLGYLMCCLLNKISPTEKPKFKIEDFLSKDK